MERLAKSDFLTGLSNRLDFQEKALIEEKRFERIQRQFTLILMDIDHFKKVNDTQGHECGDSVLVGVANSLRKALRAQDIVARWGGEEFICLLPETELKGAQNVAEKIRTTIASTPYECLNSPVSVTVTLGLCVYDGSESVEECIRNADGALYRGKTKGRNQVVVWK